MLNEMPKLLVTASTLRSEYSEGARREGLTIPHVTRSSPMEAKLAQVWVVRSRSEHAEVYTYHLETTDGEIYNETD